MKCTEECVTFSCKVEDKNRMLECADTGPSQCAERTRTMEEKKIELMALSETRWTGQGVERIKDTHTYTHTHTLNFEP